MGEVFSGFAPSFGSRDLPAPFRARKNSGPDCVTANNAGAAAGVRSNASYTTRLALVGEVRGQSAAADEFRGGARYRVASRRRRCLAVVLDSIAPQSADRCCKRPVVAGPVRLLISSPRRSFRHRLTTCLAPSAAGQQPVLAYPHAGPFPPITKRPRRAVRTSGGA